MKYCFYKILPFISISAFIVFIFVGIDTHAAGSESGYQLLADIPTITPTGTDAAGKPAITLVDYMKGLFVAVIGLAIVLAVVELVIGGIEYVAAAVPSSKEDAKKRIGGAVGGLLLILVAWILLQALNPKLLNVGLNLEKVAVVGQTTTGGGSAGDGFPGAAGGNGTCATLDNGPCAVSNLVGFCGDETKAKNASMICNAESSGDATRSSNSDRCGGPGGTGKPFSIGLFQINLTVHNISTLTCGVPAAFTAKNYACTAVDPRYTQCVGEAKNPGSNIREMVRISNGCTNWSQWSTHTKCGL